VPSTAIARTGLQGKKRSIYLTCASFDVKPNINKIT
jgi:hypothetical protein